MDALISWIKQIFADGMEFLLDLPLLILEKFLGAIASSLEGIIPPDFLADGIQPVFDAMPGDLGYFAAQLGIPAALLVFSAGVGFRLLRKFVTLFQW